MRKNKIKKMITVCLCAAMIMSVGIGANAATNASFNFTVDTGDHMGASSNAKKSMDASFAEVQYTTITFGGTSGQLFTVIRKGSTNVSSSKYLTKSDTATRNYTYKSGYGNIGDYYKVYGATSSGCSYDATLKGVWTP